MLFNKSFVPYIRLTLLLATGLLVQGCTQLTAKDNSIVHVPDDLSEDFGAINDVPDLPPLPDSKKYQQIRDELAAK